MAIVRLGNNLPEKSRKIYFILQNEYPNIYHIITSEGGFKIKNYQSDNSLTEKQFTDFYNRQEYLESLDIREIDQIAKPFLDEIEKEKIDKQNKELQNLKDKLESMNLTESDLNYYKKLPFWKVHECISLSLNKNPDKFQYSFSQSIHNSYSKKILENFDIFKRYNFILNIIDRSIKINSFPKIQQYGDITKTCDKIIKPYDYINWVKENEIDISEKIISNIKKPKIKILQEKIIQDLNDINNSLINDKKNSEKENQDLKNQINDLQKKLKEKEDSRIIKTLYQIICGISKKHYPDKTSRISRIEDTIIKQAGIELDKKTIRKHIEKALEEDQSENGNI